MKGSLLRACESRYFRALYHQPAARSFTKYLWEGDQLINMNSTYSKSTGTWVEMQYFEDLLG